MAGRFSVEAIFKAVDRVTAPVSRMQKKVGKFTRSMKRGFTKLDRTISKFARGAKRAGVAIAASMFIVGGALANVTGTGADFEQAIVNVGAVALKTRDQIKPLENLALELGRTTKFTATQAAEAMEIMSRAGFKTNEILTATPAVLAAAAASGLEIAEVADVVSNALKGMGLEATQAANVADILALASSRTNSSIGSLGESLKNVASTARQLNVPIEDTVAAIALLQDVGLDASVAGSAFNVMLTKMAAPTAGMQKKMKKLGISFKDAKGNMLPLQKVIEQLNVASKKVGGNFDKVAFLAELVGLRGQKAAANLGELFETGKLEKLTKELENASGSAKKMAALRMDTFNGSMLLLGSAVDAVKVKIFNLQDGALKGLVDKMTAWVSANEDLIATNVSAFIVDLITNMPVIVMWIERIAKGIAVFIAFTAVLKTLIGVITLVNLLVAANPITLMVLAAVALGAALAAVVIWIDDIIGAFENMNPIVRALLAPIELILRTIKAIKDVGAFLGGKIGKALFEVFGDKADDETPQAGATGHNIVTPQDRVAAAVSETTTLNKSEVTIKDETGRAEVTGGAMGNGLNLQPSGGF